MKKVMSLVMVLVCFVAMAGCGEMKESDFEPGKLVKEDFALINTETNETISLGMTRDEVESKVGKPVEEGLRVGEYEGGLTIYYRDNIVNSLILIQNDEKCYFSTIQDITLGDNISRVEEKYGKYNYESNIGITKFYIMNIKNNKVLDIRVDRTQMPKTPIEDLYIMQISAEKDDKVNLIMVADGEFFWTQR